MRIKKNFKSFNDFQSWLSEYESREKTVFVVKKCGLQPEGVQRDKFKYLYAKYVCKFFGTPKNIQPTMSREIEQEDGSKKLVKARKSRYEV